MKIKKIRQFLSIFLCVVLVASTTVHATVDTGQQDDDENIVSVEEKLPDSESEDIQKENLVDERQQNLYQQLFILKQWFESFAEEEVYGPIDISNEEHIMLINDLEHRQLVCDIGKAYLELENQINFESELKEGQSGFVIEDKVWLENCKNLLYQCLENGGIVVYDEDGYPLVDYPNLEHIQNQLPTSVSTYQITGSEIKKGQCVTITGPKVMNGQIKVAGVGNELTIIGDVTVDLSNQQNGKAAINVPENAELTIKGSGRLKTIGASGSSGRDGCGGGAGIGGNGGQDGMRPGTVNKSGSGQKYGRIVIEPDLTVDAEGGKSGGEESGGGAGIGGGGGSNGGNGGNSGTIVIGTTENGNKTFPKVTAKGHGGGAGIGSGAMTDGGNEEESTKMLQNITIYSGNVYAQGSMGADDFNPSKPSHGGAGIGGGGVVSNGQNGQSAGHIKIYKESDVTAVGGKGYASGASDGNGRILVGICGAGIGIAGENRRARKENNGSLYIEEGATVKAYSRGRLSPADGIPQNCNKKGDAVADSSGHSGEHLAIDFGNVNGSDGGSSNRDRLNSFKFDANKNSIGNDYTDIAYYETSTGNVIMQTMHSSPDFLPDTDQLSVKAQCKETIIDVGTLPPGYSSYAFTVPDLTTTNLNDQHTKWDVLISKNMQTYEAIKLDYQCQNKGDTNNTYASADNKVTDYIVKLGSPDIPEKEQVVTLKKIVEINRKLSEEECTELRRNSFKIKVEEKTGNSYREIEKGSPVIISMNQAKQNNQNQFIAEKSIPLVEGKEYRFTELTTAPNGLPKGMKFKSIKAGLGTESDQNGANMEVNSQNLEVIVTNQYDYPKQYGYLDITKQVCVSQKVLEIWEESNKYGDYRGFEHDTMYVVDRFDIQVEKWDEDMKTYIGCGNITVPVITNTDKISQTGNKKIKIPVGKYRIRELVPANYKLLSIRNIENTTENQSHTYCDITVTADATQSIIVSNQLDNGSWYSAKSSVENSMSICPTK